MRHLSALAMLVSALAISGAAAAPASSATERIFADSSGEEPIGPDIRTVTVSSDGYELTFRVAVPTNPTVTPDFRLRIWIDSDDDRSTGITIEGQAPSGLDHFLLVDPTRFPPDEAVLYGCSGSTCGPSTVAPSFEYASGATFTAAAWMFGLPRFERIRFSVEAWSGIGYDPSTRRYDFTNAHLDLAPDEGAWTYDSRPLRVTSFDSTPAQPRSGMPFTVTMRTVATASDTAPGKAAVGCRLRVAGKEVPVRTSRFARGLASCVWRIPRGSRGTRFTSTMRVTAAGTTVARSRAGTVR